MIIVPGDGVGRWRKPFAAECWPNAVPHAPRAWLAGPHSRGVCAELWEPTIEPPQGQAHFGSEVLPTFHAHSKMGEKLRAPDRPSLLPAVPA